MVFSQYRLLWGCRAASRRKRLTWDVEIDVTMPRLTTSSASSWAVQWVMGRPDFAGGSQATARIWVTCSGVNFPGARGGVRR